MARESIEERRARLLPGAQWLREERERRGWTGLELARRLDIHQTRLSAYERAQDEPPTEFIRSLAEVFGMTELDVWRSLGKALPREAATDEAVIAWAWRTHPEAMELGTGLKRPDSPCTPVGRQTASVPSGEPGSEASRRRTAAI